VRAYIFRYLFADAHPTVAGLSSAQIAAMVEAAKRDGFPATERGRLVLILRSIMVSVGVFGFLFILPVIALDLDTISAGWVVCLALACLMQGLCSELSTQLRLRDIIKDRLGQDSE